MSAKENRKISRGIRRESTKVAPAIVRLVNGSPLPWRLRLAAEVLLGRVKLTHLMDVSGSNREFKGEAQG